MKVVSCSSREVLALELHLSRVIVTLGWSFGHNLDEQLSGNVGSGATFTIDCLGVCYRLKFYFDFNKYTYYYGRVLIGTTGTSGHIPT